MPPLAGEGGYEDLAPLIEDEQEEEASPRNEDCQIESVDWW